MNKYNVVTTQVGATSRKEWLKNRRTAKASITISGGMPSVGSGVSSGAPAPSATSMAELTDVSLSAPKKGDVLYNTGAGWTNKGGDSLFVPKGGGSITGPVSIQGKGTQLTITGEREDSGEYTARLRAESIGEHYGGVKWTRDTTEIEGLGEKLQYNGKDLVTADELEGFAPDVDLSDVSISEEVEVAEDSSIITKSEFSDTPIAEEVAAVEDADTLTYGDIQRVVRVFEKDGFICVASSMQIYDDERVALARKLSQGWSGKQGWSVSRQFASDGGEGDNPTYEPHTFTLVPWASPNPKQPNGLYYYHVTIDGNEITPSTLLYYFISSLDGRLQIYWGKRAKKVAFGADSSGKYKRAASLRFGVAVGNQIAPFNLVVQSKCFLEGGRGIVLLDSTTWPECVQFRV